MNPIQKALWYVEIHSGYPICLEQVAEASDVSPYHLTRAFAANFGRPLMRYVRQRRLSEAAKRLSAGATDILTLAIEHSYSSHEAFSRAFKEEFGITPEAVRTQGHCLNLQLTKPIAMQTSPSPKLASPRIESVPRRHYVGIVERYPCNNPAGIPAQWQRFLPHFGNIRDQVGGDAYGVCYNFDDEEMFDYLTGVQIKVGSEIPLGLEQLELCESKYAVFSHPGHISEIRAVIAAIWSEGLAATGLEAIQGPMIEKYGQTFNPATGHGGFEIWIPVK